MNRRTFGTIAISSAVLLGACTAMTSGEQLTGTAWERCQQKDTKSAVNACMETEEAVLLAESEAQAEEAGQATRNSERKKAIREATGT